MNPLYTATPIWHFYRRDLGKNPGGERCRWKMNEQAGWGACVRRGGVFLGDRTGVEGVCNGEGRAGTRGIEIAAFVSI